MIVEICKLTASLVPFSFIFNGQVKNYFGRLVSKACFLFQTLTETERERRSVAFISTCLPFKGSSAGGWRWAWSFLCGNFLQQLGSLHVPSPAEVKIFWIIPCLLHFIRTLLAKQCVWIFPRIIFFIQRSTLLNKNIQLIILDRK